MPQDRTAHAFIDQAGDRRAKGYLVTVSLRQGLWILPEALREYV